LLIEFLEKRFKIIEAVESATHLNTKLVKDLQIKKGGKKLMNDKMIVIYRIQYMCPEFIALPVSERIIRVK